MNSRAGLGKVVSDIAVLYELSLAVGRSLDLQTCCERFISVLMARKNLGYVSVWIKGEYLGRLPEDSFFPVYANPGVFGREEELPPQHPIFSLLAEKDVFSLSCGAPAFSGIVTEKGIDRGSFAVFVLGRLGMMKLYSGKRETGFTTEELNQLRNVISKFAVSLEGCLAHQKAVREISERTRAEEEKRALEEQLRQSQKMEAIGRLAGGIAHDFNNLLTVIGGYSELALSQLTKGDPLGDNIQEIRKASERASELTRQLLVFSRRQILEMRTLDLNVLIQGMESMLRRVLGEDIELTLRKGSDLGCIKSDPGQIEQVVMNLAVNARDAMPSGGRLILETQNVSLDEAYTHHHIGVTPGPYVMLSVSDTGCGMTAEIRDRAFEPFFTTKEKGKGTGLGLSTVFGIVKQSNGSIWVYSEPGEGSTFKIYLPRMDEPVDVAIKSEELKEIPRGKETVLVVEDEEEVRKLAVRILKKQGYRVLEAAFGGEALMIVEQHPEPIHLILTDVVMPRMSGPELIDHLRRVRRDFKVLYMSGYTDESVVLHGVQAGEVSLLQKPFTVQMLGKRVREVLDGG